MRRGFQKITFTLMAVLATCSVHAATWNIVYPRPLTDADQRTRFPVQLLTLALDQTGVKYKLIPSDRILMQQKALKLLKENRGVNVVWSMTDKNRETQLLPVRIPIYKGLIGWRLFLADRENLSHMGRVRSMEELLKYRAIQGHDWPDTRILQSNGFEVVTRKDYLGLFTLLENKRGDFFPRSVVEIWAELSTENISSNIDVVPQVGIQYPTAMYFFVNRRNVTLAKLLSNGLEKAIDNGKYDELFEQVYFPILSKARMPERRFFQLENPLLPEQTPLDRRELWFQPEDLQRVGQSEELVEGDN